MKETEMDALALYFNRTHIHTLSPINYIHGQLICKNIMLPRLQPCLYLSIWKCSEDGLTLVVVL